MLKDRLEVDVAEPVTTIADAEGYIARVCFKTGPPQRIGVELEWVVHHRGDVTQPLDPHLLAAALGHYAPNSLAPESPHHRLPSGGTVTVEPGGQVEISSAPHRSLAELLGHTAADIALLSGMLGGAGLRLGRNAFDSARPPRRLLNTHRYHAMEAAFDSIGPLGRLMMCSTAGLQVCLDTGSADRVGARWNALHALGPALIALFANSRGRGYASRRMAIWYGTDPARTKPPIPVDDPIAAWTQRVLRTPLLCLRRPHGPWLAPAGVTFADWIDGALDTMPTYDDLDYHLSTMFSPVRARGYFEVRYLDAQPGSDWELPTVMLAALFADESTVDSAAALAAPAAGRWEQAARLGNADPRVAKVIPDLIALSCEALCGTDLPAPLIARYARRLVRKGEIFHDT